MDENMTNDVVQDTPSAVDTAPQYDEPADYSQPEESGSVESGDSNVVASTEEMSLVKDPVTGKVSLQFHDEDEQQDVPQEQEIPQEEIQQDEIGSSLTQQGQSQLEMPKYNLEEFSHALANGYVDPNRVPDEYQNQYADYRIRQAIMEQQARAQQAAMQQEQQRRAVEAQMNPENRIQANKDFYNALEEEASNAAMRDLGITKEQLDESEYSEEGEALKKNYENALSWHKQRLRSEMQARYQQEQAYKHQQQSVYDNIAQFVAEERAKEPNFDAIDRTLMTRYKSLPYAQGRQVEAALVALQNGTINGNGLQVIQDYYNNCRREFYAQRNGLKANGAQRAPKRPPVVESSGSSQQVDRGYKPNYSTLRSATVDQRSEWFKEFFKNNGW